MKNLGPINYNNKDSLEESIKEIGADSTEFNNWFSDHIKSWLAFRLIPSIISDNNKNIEAINTMLMSFKKKLKEAEIFANQNSMQNKGFYPLLSGNSHNFLNGRSNNSMYENNTQDESKHYESISIDELLRMSEIKQQSNDIGWGSFWNVSNVKSAAEINEINKNLDE